MNSCQSRGSRQRKPRLLSSPRRVGEGCPDIVLLQVGISQEDFLFRAARGGEPQHRPHGYPHPPDARTPSHDRRIVGDVAQKFHGGVYRSQQGPFDISGSGRFPLLIPILKRRSGETKEAEGEPPFLRTAQVITVVSLYQKGIRSRHPDRVPGRECARGRRRTSCGHHTEHVPEGTPRSPRQRASGEFKWRYQRVAAVEFRQKGGGGRVPVPSTGSLSHGHWEFRGCQVSTVGPSAWTGDCTTITECCARFVYPGGSVGPDLCNSQSETGPCAYA